MKTLFIMRGIPGSGKSTLAGELAELYDATICSADKYFMSEGGDFKFNAKHLPDAHDWCFKRFMAALDDCELYPSQPIRCNNSRLIPKSFH